MMLLTPLQELSAVPQADIRRRQLECTLCDVFPPRAEATDAAADAAAGALGGASGGHPSAPARGARCRCCRAAASGSPTDGRWCSPSSVLLTRGTRESAALPSAHRLIQTYRD